VADVECRCRWPDRGFCGDVRVFTEEEKLIVSTVHHHGLMLLFSEFICINAKKIKGK
jgi:hypothetical protein